MKTFLPILCSLLLIGCSDSTQTEVATAVPQTTTQSIVPALEANESSTPVTEPAKTTSTPTIVKASVTTETDSVDGGGLFGQKCAACHGSKAEKSALGKSQIIAGWKETQSKDALKGYQSGTYGKEMKAVMQGQAKGLNDVQIDALAKYISTL